jgi:hypothetical protein
MGGEKGYNDYGILGWECRCGSKLETSETCELPWCQRYKGFRMPL